MTRCEFVYDFERDSADWGADKVAHFTADPEQVRKHALLKGARCTVTHEDERDSCSRDGCSYNEHVIWPSFHRFEVDGTEYVYSLGIMCWDCWRDDCGGSWLQP